MPGPGETQAEPSTDLDRLFEELYRDYQQPILTYLCRLVGDAGRAEELAQDVFVRAYGALAKLPDNANRRAWLYRIATNLAYDHFRRLRLVRWLPLKERDGDVLPVVHSGPDPTADEVAVEHVLMQLSPDYRAPLILYSVHGYSAAEIAQMLGISEGAVKTRLYRARERFRVLYWGER